MSRLKRLLKPRSIAFIGGREAEVALAKTRALGFAGTLHAVNPRRETMAGIACVAHVDDLPDAPDAAFVAVPREASIEVVRALAALGAGGAVCYASGFAETGAHGAALQSALLDVAGGMPVMGPNCYGFINYLERCALWPDEHGGRPCGRGVAIVTQSGNMGLNMTLSRRGLPLAGIYTLGNQADIDLAQTMDALVEDERVSAIGLHIEGLRDIEGFAAAAARAWVARKPLVALKTGRSEAGARVALSHTGSLAGTDTLYDALFARYGIARAASVTAFLEALKFLHVVGPLAGSRICSMSCSGGEAALVADLAEGRALAFPAFDAATAKCVRAVLNDYVAIENPLDYHTFIWADRERTARCFTAVLSGGFDLTMLVLDTPTSEGTIARNWEVTAEAFAEAVRESGRAGAVVTTLPECLPETMATSLAEAGIAPMAGLDDALAAFEAAARIGAVHAGPLPAGLTVPQPSAAPERTLTEHAAKRMLAAHGIPVMEGVTCTPEQAAEAACRLGFPVAFKASGEHLHHKSELGGVVLNLATAEAVDEAARKLVKMSDEVLVERMAPGSVAEILVGAREDPQFGLALVLGAGGVMTELLHDTATLLLPATRDGVERALSSLKVARLVDGFRGRSGDREALVDAILKIADFALAHAGRLVELDVNPLIVHAPRHGVTAVDALIRLRDA